MNSMGNFAEKLRSGGLGIPAFYCRSGIDTLIANGGMPVKLGKNGSIEEYSLPKETREFYGQKYLLEKTITTDYSLVKAWKADKLGNCIFKMCAQNYNVDVGSAGKVCIVEADEIVEIGDIDGDDIQLAGVFVHRVVKSNANNLNAAKAVPKEGNSKNKAMLKRAAEELKKCNSSYIGFGLPKLATRFVDPLSSTDFFSDSGISGYNYSIDNKNEPTLVDSDMMAVNIKKNGAIMKSSDAFSALRGGHLDVALVDAYQVSENGDIANWSKGGVLEGPKATVDVINKKTPLIVVMEHVDSNGKPKILSKCTLPLTGEGCVSRIITDMGVFDVKSGKLTLIEIAKGVTVDEVKQKTEAKFSVKSPLKIMDE
jgi:3-oxoacid CoA-transferase